MHWTQLLERRYLPAHATVIDDIHCFQCSYNLRGLRARGLCPECGRPVGDSLFLLTRPDVVSSAFTGFGASYLALIAIPLSFFISAGGIVWLGLLMLVAGCMVRVWSAFMLRWRAGLSRLPAIGGLTTRLFVLAVGEFAALLSLAFSLYMMVLTTTITWTVYAFALLPCVWLMTLLVALQATQLASRIGELLEFDLIAREARIQWILGCILAAVSVVFFLLQPAFLIAFLILLALTAVPTWIYTMLCLWHTGNAAAQALSTRDDAIDLEPQSFAEQRPDLAHNILPEIKVD